MAVDELSATANSCDDMISSHRLSGSSSCKRQNRIAARLSTDDEDEDDELLLVGIDMLAASFELDDEAVMRFDQSMLAVIRPNFDE